jgi:PAS domain S-box-containing protein
MDLDREALLQLYDSLEAVLEQPGPEAEAAFRASLANVQGGLDETNDEALDVALRTVRRTLHRGQPPTLPPVLSQREDWSELLAEIETLQRFILTLGKGDLKQSLPLRGLMAGGLKALQANLRHLTWQTQQIAKGDFDQRVDFMGEFSTAFNKMVRALKESQADLQRRERELSQANADLRREIADRRQIEEALQASLERYDELVARIPVGIYVIWLLPDDAMKFQYVSDRWCDIHQVNRDAVLADASVANALIHPEDLDAFLARNQEALRSREPFSWEGRFVIGDEIRWLQIESTPEVTQDGNVRWFGVTQDITERKRAEAALKRANEEAEEARRVAEAANQAKSAFLAKMSHELRTPMNAVLGFSELMVNDPNLTADQRENLDIIRHSGEHLLALINDVLDFSKIEAGKADVQPETFDLHRTLRSLEEMFSLRAKHKGLTVNVDLASDIPRYIRADEGKLRQVLINLLSNAVKFTERGSITVRLRTEGQDGHSQ